MAELQDAFRSLQNTSEGLDWIYKIEPTGQESTSRLARLCVLEGLMSVEDDFPSNRYTKHAITRVASETSEAISLGNITVACRPMGEVPKGLYGVEATSDQIKVGLVVSHDWLDKALTLVDKRSKVVALGDLVGAVTIAHYFMAPERYEEYVDICSFTPIRRSFTEDIRRDYALRLPETINERAWHLRREVIVVGMREPKGDTAI